MKISTKSQYGLRAMAHLANSKEKICCLKLISEKEGISFDYLEKIMSKLEKEGLVDAKKGVKGGYFLKKPAKKIRIGEIIESLEGKTFLARCLGSKKNFKCSRAKKCSARRIWKRLQESLATALNSITLADLIEK